MAKQWHDLVKAFVNVDGCSKDVLIGVESVSGGAEVPPGELAASAAGSAAAAASSAASLVCAPGRRSWWSCGDERSWSMHIDRVDDEAEEVGDGLGCLNLMFDSSI